MIPFVKVQGIGNDFVLIDGIRRSWPDVDFGLLARAMGDRRFGVGSDGLLLAEPIAENHFRMRMWNPDGSESEMCGNGIRCFAKYLRDEGHATSDSFLVETGAGPLRPEILADGRIRVDMGPPRLTRGDIGMSGDPGSTFIDRPVEVGGMTLSGTAVSMGNPHLVLFVENVKEIPLEKWGPILECHAEFPNRVNAHFVEVSSREHLIQRTWERGAGATLACGTGACAAAVAGRVTGRSADVVRITLPGGDLDIECREGANVFMTGPAVEVFRGEWPD